MITSTRVDYSEISGPSEFSNSEDELGFLGEGISCRCQGIIWYLSQALTRIYLKIDKVPRRLYSLAHVDLDVNGLY